MFFIPAVAISAWFGGLGPSILATAMSLALIRINLLGPSWIGPEPRNGTFAVVAFVVVAVTIAVTMEALRRARALADSHAANLEGLNAEVNRSATRATRLLDVTTALLEAQSVEDVADVVLGKGLGVVEAKRGVLACADGDRVSVVGARGYSPELEARARALTLNSDVPLMDAFRRGEAIWIGWWKGLGREQGRPRQHILLQPARRASTGGQGGDDGCRSPIHDARVLSCVIGNDD
jgi:hypothetical protein